MKEFFNSVKRDFVILAIADLMVGILLLLYPQGAALTICYICAAIVSFYGIMHLVSYFINRYPDDIYRYDLVQGIIGGVAGIFLFAKPEFLQGVLPVVLGISVIIDSLIKLQHAFDLSRIGYGNWWLLLIIAVGAGALGVLMIINPFETATTLLMFIGISLIINGVLDFWNIFYLSHKIKQFKNNLQQAQEAAQAIEIDPIATEQQNVIIDIVANDTKEE